MLKILGVRSTHLFNTSTSSSTVFSTDFQVQVFHIRFRPTQVKKYFNSVYTSISWTHVYSFCRSCSVHGVRSKTNVRCNKYNWLICNKKPLTLLLPDVVVSIDVENMVQFRFSIVSILKHNSSISVPYPKSFCYHYFSSTLSSSTISYSNICLTNVCQDSSVECCLYFTLSNVWYF